MTQSRTAVPMVQYSAFISYRHLQPDMEIAKAIQRRIETYGIPRAIAQSRGRKHFDRVFRDQDELPLMSDLGEGIREALRHSEWLIVICTPELPKSRWCMAEIEFFIELGRRDRILPILVAGEPEQSFPDCLRHVTGADGRVTEIEPLAADVRAADARTRNKLLKTETLRLIAPMLRVGYDDLRRRARERMIRLTALTTLAAALVLAGFGTYALSQSSIISRQNEQLTKANSDLAGQIQQTERQRALADSNAAWARQERDEALSDQSKYLAGQAEQQQALGAPAIAQLLALEALPGDSSADPLSRPLVPEAASALRSANTPIHQSDYLLVGALNVSDWNARDAYIPQEDLFLAGKNTQILQRADAASATLCEKLRKELYSDLHAYDASRRLLVALSSDHAAGDALVCDFTNGSQRSINLYDKQYGINALALIPHSDRLLCGDFLSVGGSFRVIDIGSGEHVFRADGESYMRDMRGEHLSATGTVGFEDFALHPDGRSMLLLTYGKTTYWTPENEVYPVLVLDTDTFTLQQTYLSTPSRKYDSAQYSPDGAVVALLGSDAVIELRRSADWSLIASVGQPSPHNGYRVDYQFSPDSQYLVMAAPDDSLAVHRATDGAPVPTGIKTAYRFVDVTDDCTLVYLESPETDIVHCYDLATQRASFVRVPGGLMGISGSHQILGVQPVRVSPGGLMTRNREGMYQFWRKQPAWGTLRTYAPSDQYGPIAYRPDGKVFAAAHAADDTTTVYDADTLQPLLNLGAGNRAYNLRWSPDGAQVLISRQNAKGIDHKLALFDAATGQQLCAIEEVYAGQMGNLQFEVSPDWRYLLLGGGSQQSGVYDLATMRQLYRLDPLFPDATASGNTLFLIHPIAAFLDGGSRVAVSVLDDLVILDTATGAVLNTVAFDDIVALAASPDQTTLLVWGRPADDPRDGLHRTIALDADTLAQRWVSEAYGATMGFSGDGNRIVLGGGADDPFALTAAKATVLDVATGRTLGTFQLGAPSLNQDGSLICGQLDARETNQSAYDGTGRGALYEVATGQRLITLPETGIFRPGVDEVLMRGGVWQLLPLADEMRVARELLMERTLTDQEKQRFFLQ